MTKRSTPSRTSFLPLLSYVIEAYFTLRRCARSCELMWGWMKALVGLVIRLFSPLLGAIAGAGGRLGTMEDGRIVEKP